MIERVAMADVARLYRKLNVTVEDRGELEYMECGDCSLRFFNPIITGNEAFYARLQNNDWYYMEQKPEYETSLKWLPREGKILEVGAGEGAFSRYCGTDRYVGLEFNKQAIESAGRKGIRLYHETIEQHAGKSPATYSAVVMFQVLEHAASPGAFLSSAIDTLADGGLLIIAVPSEDGFLGEVINNPLNMPPHHVTRWPDRVLRNLETILPIKLVAISHEPVASFHQHYFRRTRMNIRLRKIMGMQRRLVDTSIMATVVQKCASLLSLLIREDPSGHKGHTVIGVYEKRAGEKKGARIL